MGPTTHARFVHNRRRGGGGAQCEASDDDEQQATSSSSSEEEADDEGEEVEASSEEEVGGCDDEEDEGEADAAEPAAKEFPQAPATGGEEGPDHHQPQESVQGSGRCEKFQYRSSP
jgi:hypothetical protein